MLYPHLVTVDPAPTVTLRRTHRYASPGTRFVIVRISSQRDGDPDTVFARIDNLARVRVVVR